MPIIQSVQYLLTLNKYKILYLIDKDCVVDIVDKTIYTIDVLKYMLYQAKIPLLKKPSKFDELLTNFEIKEIEYVSDIL